MHKRALTKPDGRALILYGRSRSRTTSLRRARPAILRSRQPPAVAPAARRMGRLRQPPAEPDVSAARRVQPARADERPRERRRSCLPARTTWRSSRTSFPTLVETASRSARRRLSTRARGVGACEVVVFTQDPRASLGTLPLWHLAPLIDVWADRYRELGARDEIHYVFEFENRGVEVGVTLAHPHGQIYAYPVRAAGRGPRAAAPARVPARARPRPARGSPGGGDCGRPPRCCTASDAGGRRAARVCPLLVRGVGRANQAGGLRRRPDGRRTRTSSPAHSRPSCSSSIGCGRKPFPYVMVFHQAPTDGAAASRGARPHRVLPGLPDAGSPEVPRRQRAGRRRVHRGHAARGEGARASGSRG